MLELPINPDAAPNLRGTRVLVVEDDFLILVEIEAILQDAGAEPVGLCRDVDEALAFVDGNLDVALLDLRLGQGTAAPIVRALTEHRTPFVFYTGQVDTDPVLAEWPGCRVVSKPASPHMIVSALLEAIAAA